MSSQQYSIGLVGGGTAGHIWPTIEVGKVLQEQLPGVPLYYFGVRGGLEEQIAKEQKFEFVGIVSGKWHRFVSLANLFVPLKIMQGLIQARRQMKRLRVKVLFAKGGFVSFPVVLAAWTLGIPVVGHESDSVMGKTNSYLSRFMKKIAVAFPPSLYPFRLRRKLFYAGIPLRSEFFQADPSRVVKRFNLQEDLPILVVTGGSQGALFLNKLVWDHIEWLLTKAQVIHLTGEQGEEESKRVKTQLPVSLRSRYHPLAFSYDMPHILKAADLVISRAGANTLFELAFLRKAVILVPYPYAAQNHQFFNAKFAVSLGGAKMFVESRFSWRHFQHTLEYLLAHPEERQRMGENLAQLYRPKAAERIAKEVAKWFKA